MNVASDYLKGTCFSIKNNILLLLSLLFVVKLEKCETMKKIWTSIAFEYPVKHICDWWMESESPSLLFRETTHTLTHTHKQTRTHINWPFLVIHWTLFAFSKRFIDRTSNHLLGFYSISDMLCSLDFEPRM